MTVSFNSPFPRVLKHQLPLPFAFQIFWLLPLKWWSPPHLSLSGFSSREQDADLYKPLSWNSSPMQKKLDNTFVNENASRKSIRHNGPNVKHLASQTEQETINNKVLSLPLSFVPQKMEHERSGKRKSIWENRPEKNDIKTTLTKISAWDSFSWGQTLLQNNPELRGLQLVPLLPWKFTCGAGTKAQRDGSKRGRRWQQEG